jgi:hypothetical protein
MTTSSSQSRDHMQTGEGAVRPLFAPPLTGQGSSCALQSIFLDRKSSLSRASKGLQ